MENQKFIVRSDRAGVFFGEVKERNGSEIVMTHVRRLWEWAGATECIGLAVNGVTSPKNCKFTVYVDEMTILDVIEIIPCTKIAEKRIDEVEPWTV